MHIISHSARHMPGGINERCLEFQPVKSADFRIARGPVITIGEKLAALRADLLSRHPVSNKESRQRRPAGHSHIC